MPARDWTRHTDPPWICPLMLRAMAAVLAVRVDVSREGPRWLRLEASERTRSDAWRACEELLRHEGEAVELLERFSAEPRLSGPSGEQ